MPALVNRARVGANIRAARERAGLSRADLAVLLDTTAGTIGRWEQGWATFRPDGLALIADRLGVSVRALTRGAGGGRR